MTALPIRARLTRAAARMRERYRSALRDLERARDDLHVAESALMHERRAVERCERRLSDLGWKLKYIRRELERERDEETAA